MSIFKQLSELNVNDHVEQKGRFKYLSWTWAVSELRKASPSATWEVIKYDNMPFCKTECGYFVEVAVTVDGITLSQIHPVLDNNNKTIPVPNAFQINTSIQRCLVKAIALHGLGLYIYAGEDLPDVDEPEPVKQQSVKPIVMGLVFADMQACKTLDQLKLVFGDAYKRADATQKVEVKAKYDEIKSFIEGN